MAMPQISNNSPIAGAIAWTAFGIQFDGVSYSIAAGSSSKKFVWWEYNGGAPILRDGDTLPDLRPEDCLLFLNRNGIGALAPTTQVIDGSIIVSGSVFADAIAANQIDAWHLRANAVTTEALAAGSVQADNIAAGAITASKLTIGAVGDNMVLNGSFEDGVGGWEIRTSGAGAVADVVSGVASSGAFCLRLVRGTSATNLEVGSAPAFYVPVTPVGGRKWYVSVRYGSPTAYANGFHFRAYWYKGDKTASSVPFTSVANNISTSTTWDIVEGSVTPPSDAKYMALVAINARSGATMYIDEVTAHEVVVSAQIGDGAITAPKIEANAVNATHIQTGSITASSGIIASLDAGVISTGTLNAARLATGSITADKVLIGTGANLAPDPSFLIPTAWTPSSYVQATGGRATGLGSLVMPSGSSYIDAYMGPDKTAGVQVQEGQQFRLSAYFTSSTTVGAANRVSLMVMHYVNNSWMSQFVVARNTGTVAANTWTRLSGNITIPAGVTHIALGFVKETAHTGVLRWSEPTVQLRNTGELIVDGAIDGQTITGATIQTTAAADRGTKITSTGIQAWDNSGVPTFNIDSTSGAIGDKRYRPAVATRWETNVGGTWRNDVSIEGQIAKIFTPGGFNALSTAKTKYNSLAPSLSEFQIINVVIGAGEYVVQPGSTYADPQGWVLQKPESLQFSGGVELSRRTSNLTGINSSTWVTVQAFNASVTGPPPGYAYKLTFGFTSFSTSTSDLVAFRITRNANELIAGNAPANSSPTQFATGYYHTITAYDFSTVNENRYYAAQVQRPLGNGSITVSASASNPSLLSAEIVPLTLV